ncbi:ATP-dependent DNA helicase RecG [Chitinispirillales bacterium ANBcel5]|uniref:ATP-dependent DNA helicase RecG n=1 Tax=Cellulosispirillum alkaliphilum TaxID=3039283 RepID=UPI002A5779B9|nr:ATP-dependent DNA helicase RecG [Chitinispirillales bacterium ANBcel5]
MDSKPIKSRLDFLTPLSQIPNFGPKRVAALKAHGIATIGDLLYYFPTRYIDRSKAVAMADLEQYRDAVCTVCGTVRKVRYERGRKPRFRVSVEDKSGKMEAIWFQGAQIYNRTIKPEMRLILTGKIGYFGGYQMVHPMIEELKDENHAVQPYVSLYSIKERMRVAGLSQKNIRKAIDWILDSLKNYPRVLPQSLEKRKNFPDLFQCLKQIHKPESTELKRYWDRIRYEQLYKTALSIRWNRRKYALPGRSLEAGDLVQQMKGLLPFSLTADQLECINVLHRDAASENRMHRLLQGDVGSGKTLVGFFATLPALNEGLQVAWMAPTEVLAKQTFTLVQKWLTALGFKAKLLCSGVSSIEKREILKDLSSGALQFVVGTHSLFMPSVRYNTLGMIVIDEQQRFGAGQRLQLQEKDHRSDFLMMSATPIPQTVAKTLYGDLDLLTLHSTPPGRTAVSTHLVPQHKKGDMISFLQQQINSGGRVYYVVPRIEAVQDGEATKSLEEIRDELIRNGLSSVGIGCVHGKMKSEERDLAVKRFKEGKDGLLMATSIIEVGMDVSEATVIVIQGAQHFGMAQLHQLRGRVGRGDKKSYCFLLSDTADEENLTRLKQFCSTTDGFKISEIDFKLRGPGELNGFKQSGWDDPGMAELFCDPQLFTEVMNEVELLFR